MKDLKTGEEIQLEIGDVVKKDLRERESWTVVEENGRLMLHPITRDTNPQLLEIEGDYIRIAHVTGLQNQLDSYENLLKFIRKEKEELKDEIYKRPFEIIENTILDKINKLKGN